MIQMKPIKIIFLVAALYLFFVALFTNPLADYDLWGYLAFGHIFWEDHYFPFHDVFSYTPTKALWIYHEWLTGTCFYPIYKYAGDAGLQLLRYIVIWMTLCLMYLTAMRRGGNTVWALISIIPASWVISFGYVPVRAQIFTYLFFVLTLYILEITKKDRKWLRLGWLLPVQILWCNLHGGFLSGLGLIFLYALGERVSGRKTAPFVMIGFMAIPLTLLNPYGIQYWTYILQSISMPRPEINEWHSVLAAMKKGIYQMPAYLFLSVSFLCSILYGFYRKPEKTDLFVLATTFFLGLTHVRHTVFFGLVFGSYLPLILNRHWAALEEKQLRIARGSWQPRLILVVLLISIYPFISPSLYSKVTPSFRLMTPSPHYPMGAYKWIADHSFKGNILPHFEWGEFLIWSCHPFCRVAIDGRYETVYEEQFSKEYFLFLNGKDDGHDFLNKYPHDMVLIRANTPAEALLQKDPAWKKVYSDNSCVIYLGKGWSVEGIKSMPE